MTENELFKACVRSLEENGTDNAHMEVKWLFENIFSEKNIERQSDKEVEPQVCRDVQSKIKKRTEGYPLQYILGEWEFYGLTFKVGEGVLIPRQDTETAVDIAIKKFKGKKNLTVLDLCAGSGCIGLTLEKNLDTAEVVFVERSAEALRYLKENMALHGSKGKAVQGDVLDGKTAENLPQADIILCNPPYLTSHDMENLQKEVSFEPKQALFGGEDGLDFYRGVTRFWKNRLKQDGMLIFEIGIGQEDEVMEIMRQHKFTNIRCHKDLCGINRCVSGRIPKDDGNFAVKVDYEKAGGNYL